MSPSILDQYKEAAPEARDPKADEDARKFTQLVMSRLRRVMDEEKVPTHLVIDLARVKTFVNALNWYLRTEMRAFLGYEEKKLEFKREIARIGARTDLTNAEKRHGIELCRRHIAGINQWEQGFEWVFALGSKELTVRSESDEEMDKLATAVASIIVVAIEARNYFGVQLLQEQDDGSTRDALLGLRFPELEPPEDLLTFRGPDGPPGGAAVPHVRGDEPAPDTPEVPDLPLVP